MARTSIKSHVLKFLALLLLCALCLQLYFLGRVALMRWVDPQSTTFQRSEIWRLAVEKHEVLWSQTWVPDADIAQNLHRAVIASEDAGFADHNGVEWDALEKAWEKNQRAAAQAAAAQAKIDAARAKQEAALKKKASKAASSAKPAIPTPPPKPVVVAKVVGGSTITQQLAKNLFLGSERHFARKAQEFLITFMLEALLSKERILEIYLNNVEWGEGIFGAEAAAHHYFHISATKLSPMQSAQLAVMLPAPKRFEKKPFSPYVMSRASTITARMPHVEWP